MPLFELECKPCEKRFEALLKSKDELHEVYCPTCGGYELTQCFTTFGGYHINGDNSASVRPRQAGAFKGKGSQ